MTHSGDAGDARGGGAGVGWSLLAASLLAVPVGAIAWFELLYLAFGLTGRDPAPWLVLATCVLSFSVAFGWPLFRSREPAALVVRRACRLGLVVSLLLPVVAFAVLFIWESAEARPDLGMGGLMLYSLPFVALAVAVVLALLFAVGEKLAARRLPL